MSPKNPNLLVGLIGPGLVGVLALGLAIPAGVSGDAPHESEAPSVPDSVLLLSNGRILRGPLTEDASGYVILQKAGTIRFPRRQVEKVFRTIREVYDYKLARIARQDPDEHMKLALWCIEEHLKPEARERLASVLELDPGNQQALAMTNFLQAEDRRMAERAARRAMEDRLKDPEVERAGAEVAEPKVDRPEALDEALLRRAQQAMKVNALPQVFDLPPDQSLKRYLEFGSSVHPVMQNACARCHGEQYPGTFRMVGGRNQREWGREEVVRTNLDAVLSLVNVKQPSQSALLANALLPHGPNRRPVLRGPNDRAYRILAEWVRRIAAATPEATVQAARQRSVGEAFAADRGFAASPTPAPAAAATAPAAPGIPGGPASVYQPRPAPLPANDDPFYPVSPLLPGSPSGVGDPEAPEGGPPGDLPAELPPLPGTPPMPNPAPAPPAGGEEKAPKKKARIDPALLEQLFKSRNGGGAP